MAVSEGDHHAALLQGDPRESAQGDAAQPLVTGLLRTSPAILEAAGGEQQLATAPVGNAEVMEDLGHAAVVVIGLPEWQSLAETGVGVVPTTIGGRLGGEVDQTVGDDPEMRPLPHQERLLEQGVRGARISTRCGQTPQGGGCGGPASGSVPAPSLATVRAGGL